MQTVHFTQSVISMKSDNNEDFKSNPVAESSNKNVSILDSICTKLSSVKEYVCTRPSVIKERIISKIGQTYKVKVIECIKTKNNFFVKK
ncbi:MAG: hypothetical protein KAG53_06500 [Endozoicomonadaceae bacterium]|nr:hypothetical protein [Endozoicomonadaceae bacterium]